MKAKEGSDLYIAQPVTFETMYRAREYAIKIEKDLEIELYTVSFPEDTDVIPEYFHILPNLTQSVLDFGNFNVQRKLPLLKDIINSVFNHTEAEFVIYTNVDIALMPTFYLFIYSQIKKGFDCFSINKRIISNKLTSIEDLNIMYSEIGKPHPGHDCFVLKRDIIPKLQVGEVCVGIPFVALPLISGMIVNSKAFRIFNNLHVTFHIGDEMSWSQNKFDDFKQYNRAICERLFLRYKNDGLFEEKPLLSNLYDVFHAKGRIWERLSEPEFSRINAVNHEHAAYLLYMKQNKKWKKRK